MDRDSVYMHYEPFSMSAYAYYDEATDPVLRLYAYSSTYQAWGNTVHYGETKLTGNSADSTGVFQRSWAEGQAFRSFEVGDTLDPNSELTNSILLAFQDGLVGGTLTHPPVWYLGFVKLIQGKKHVGYAKIGTELILNRPYFWFEEVKLATCPWEPIIIE